MIQNSNFQRKFIQKVWNLIIYKNENYKSSQIKLFSIKFFEISTIRKLQLSKIFWNLIISKTDDCNNSINLYNF